MLNALRRRARDHQGVADGRSGAKEEDILYPMAQELLSDADVIVTMTEEMRGRRVKAGLMGC